MATSLLALLGQTQVYRQATPMAGSRQYKNIGHTHGRIKAVQEHRPHPWQTVLDLCCTGKNVEKFCFSPKFFVFLRSLYCHFEKIFLLKFAKLSFWEKIIKFWRKALWIYLTCNLVYENLIRDFNETWWYICLEKRSKKFAKNPILV